MRFIRRTQAIVPAFREKGACFNQGRKDEQEWLANLTNPAAFKLTFPDYWNRSPDVRGALYAMHGWCCGFCSSFLPLNDRGDVEHFRPKGKIEEDSKHGGYWWLAYNFENYLLSCSRCNSACKRTHFPLIAGGKRITYKSRHKLSAEPRLLIDPTLDPIEDWLTAEWSDSLCPIKAKEDLNENNKAQVEYLLELFRINIDPRLVIDRIKVRDQVADAILEKRFEDASPFAIRYRPHSFTAKQMLSEKAPVYLPTINTEILWLLDELIKILDITLKFQKEKPKDKKLEKQANELLWSLAVIWHDPPDGVTVNIEEFLAVKGKVDPVRELFDQIQINN